MPNFLAIEWDSREARLVVARSRGVLVTLEHAFSVAVGAHPDRIDDLEAATGKIIGQALAQHRMGKMTTLVGVGRANIELKRLTLPPSPADELPDLVRFAALREFNSLDDSWPLDFLPQSSD